jgi:hypothetical protein
MELGTGEVYLKVVTPPSNAEIRKALSYIPLKMGAGRIF